MKTDDFISLLATGVAPVDRYALTKRFGVAVLAGAAGATLIMEVVIALAPSGTFNVQSGTLPLGQTVPAVTMSTTRCCKTLACAAQSPPGTNSVCAGLAAL